MTMMSLVATRTGKIIKNGLSSKDNMT